ncbi:MAG TPA: BamA/TamA family outer membrane protein [Steroidobacteraceae bacterium]|nr:BamA/TamA family outer membrane protein [Steroidobacteraceae bacterium]
MTMRRPPARPPRACRCAALCALLAAAGVGAADLPPPLNGALTAQIVPPAPPIPPPPPGQPGPTAPNVPTKQQGPPAGAPAAKKKPAEARPWYWHFTRWLDPKTAPFLPVPEIASDPNGGTTVGIIPTILVTDEQDDIRKIIAPDLIHNPYFGWGVHGRIYSYDSQDEQWSVVTNIQQRVERGFDGEYQVGRTRQGPWSFNGSAIYNVDGTPRFYGIGNESLEIDQTNYTAQEYLLQSQLGYNITHALQLQYTSRFEDVDVLPGTLSSVPSIETRFGSVLGEHTNKQVLNRLSLIYDTRDDIIIPSSGAELVAYSGMASRNGFLNDSMYSEAGFDGRAFFPVADKSVIAAHMALRYLLTAHDVPFWALSSIGGADAMIGGNQLLRGYGDGRFYDRDSFSSTVEFRRNVATFHAVATTVQIELAPFIDVGRVFDRTSTLPFDQLHKVYGMGFRGLARPYVVGYVDVGYGTEGAAVFTGISYPF